ncbi:hypothetical protein MTO96_007532, partial [Rhipicephalus appendiculatus]
MKTFVLLALCGAAFAAGDFDSQCLPRADPGPCKGYFPRWWYNLFTGKCEEFIYGGCQGNDNQYKTKEECEKTCAHRPMRNFACLGKPDQGPCRASIPRYYYDNATRTCKQFTYGGCEGNSNNYETVEECKASCNPATEYEANCLARAETGPCRAHATLWAYDAKLGECKTFTYGGCDGNENKYPTKEKCEETCKHPPTELVEEYAMAFQQQNGLKAPLNPVCSLPKEPGLCNGWSPSFYYNTERQQCESFIYGGCLGNENRFRTQRECRSTCVPTNPVCYEPKKVGPCKAYVPRYFYNTTTKFCERFIYGGCQANGNNFPELEVCLKTCTRKDSVCYQAKDKGPCFGYFPRYYYNTTTNTCEEFIYGGCKGNANNFETLRQCQTKCGNVSLTEELIRSKLLTKFVTHDALCELPVTHGPCRGHMIRYYYSTTTNTCEEFVYGGCEGNPNNFQTLQACENRCG